MAFRKGMPVEGTVEQVIKGGYEVRVGKARGFCPHSQIELHHVDKPEQYIGKTLPFRVLQLRRGGEEAVLSRRALLEERATDERKAVRATLIEGHVTQGHVVRVTDFGAFVDLGAGVTGLVHVSEIAHGRILRPADVLAPGQTVQVKVLKLDDESGKISLSIRQAARDPWEGASERFKVGDVVQGTVRRVADFGAFVELDGEMEALAPVDAFPPSVTGWKEAVAIGSTGSWRIASIDPARHRMAVHPADGDGAQAPALAQGAKVKGRVQRAERFGVFVWLRPGVVGLMPGIYTGTRKGTDLARAFPVGREVDAEVVETDAEGKRIRLSMPGAAAKAEASAPPPRRDRERERERERREPDPPTQSAPAEAFGTSLADALRAAIKKNEA